MPASWTARWIWDQGDPAPHNYYLCFRKKFRVTSTVNNALLKITADSRYRVWVNNHPVGQGPVRCWPWEQSFDEYDVSHLLTPGADNVVAVLVYHPGRSTFQYVHGRGGLLAELTISTKRQQRQTITTDKTWTVQQHHGYQTNTPRISCQQAFMEAYDARNAPEGWTEAQYNDSQWQPAFEVGPVGTPPWTKLVRRTIAALTMEPVYPVYLETVQPVSTKNIVSATIDLNHTLAPGWRSSDHYQLEGFVVTVVQCSRAIKKAEFAFHGDCQAVWLNGKRLTHQHAPLKRGDNLLVIDVSRFTHTLSLGVAIKSPGLNARLALPSASADTLAGAIPVPLHDQQQRAKLCRATSFETLVATAPPVAPIVPAHSAPYDLFAMCTLQDRFPEKPVKVEHLDGLLSESTTAMVLHPTPSQHDVELRLDFGKMTVGYVELELDAPEGVVVDLNGIEAKQDGEIIYTQGLYNTLRYITCDGHQVYRAMVRRGFRYLEVTLRNLTSPVKLHRVMTYLNTFPVAERGQFHCSDPQLNAIWKLGAWTERLCMEDTFVDCPTYEQTFWVGDARNEALINYAAFGDRAMTGHGWKLVAGSLKRAPITQSQVPSGWSNLIPAWHFLWVLGCEEYYRYSGDFGFVKSIYPALAQSARNLEQHLNDKGLFEIAAWNFLDWAPMDIPERGVVTHQNAWAVAALERTSRLAKALGKTKDAQRWDTTAHHLSKAINQHLWNEKKQAYVDCLHEDGTPSAVISQQTNTVAYLCNVAPERCVDMLAKKCVDPPTGWVQAGSPFFMFFVFEALARQNRHADILRLVRARWGEMLDKEATTCWETFPQPNTKVWTRSFCHAWSAGPTYFLSSYQLGVTPLKPGFSEALIAPVPVDLRWAKGRFPTPHGEIEVWWEQHKTSFVVRVQLPKGVRGVVQLPFSGDRITDIKKPVGWRKKSPDGTVWSLPDGGHGEMVVLVKR